MFTCSPEEVKTLVALQNNITTKLELENFLQHGVQKINKIDQKRAKARQLLDTVSQQIETLRNEYKTNEGQLKEIEGNIAKSNQKLSTVKNDKEYSSIQKEINDLNKSSHDLSDTGLKVLEKLEATEKQFNAKEKDICTFLDTSAKQLQDLKKKFVLVKKQLQKLDDNAKKLKASIKDDMLCILEDNIIHNLNHLGVVRVEGAICQGCNVNVPRQVFNELQKNQVIDLCPNCKRLIYWEPEKAA